MNTSRKKAINRIIIDTYLKGREDALNGKPYPNPERFKQSNQLDQLFNAEVRRIERNRIEKQTYDDKVCVNPPCQPIEPKEDWSKSVLPYKIPSEFYSKEQVNAILSEQIAKARVDERNKTFDFVNAVNNAAKESNKAQRKMVDDYAIQSYKKQLERIYKIGKRKKEILYWEEAVLALIKEKSLEK